MSEQHIIKVKETSPGGSKKPYTAPQLVEYGHISQLTAGTTGSSGDKGTLSNHHGQG